MGEVAREEARQHVRLKFRRPAERSVQASEEVRPIQAYVCATAFWRRLSSVVPTQV